MEMRIRKDCTVPRKMLGYGRHTRAAQPACKCVCQVGNGFRLAMKRAVADDLTDAPVEVDARRENQVDARGAQLGRDQPAHLAREQQGGAEELFYLVKIDKAKFTRTVLPGDQLVLEVTQHRILRRMGFYSCEAKVDGKRVACCEILCAGK